MIIGDDVHDQDRVIDVAIVDDQDRATDAPDRAIVAQDHANGTDGIVEVDADEEGAHRAHHHAIAMPPVTDLRRLRHDHNRAMIRAHRSEGNGNNEVAHVTDADHRMMRCGG